MTVKAAVVFGLGILAAGAASAVDLVIATVNNGHMIEMQKLTPVLREGQPRHQAQVGDARRRRAAPARHHRHRHQGRPVRRDDDRHVRNADLGQEGLAATRSSTDAAYDVDDLLPAMRTGLSVDGKLYAAPFYGESSMLMYRKDLTDKAGVKFARAADLGRRCSDARRQDARPEGRRLRHLPARQAGLGRQHGLPHDAWSTRFGGQWFDMSWKPQLDTKPWKDAVTLLRRPAEELRPARLVGQQLQRDPGAVQRRQVRHVGRRDDRRLVHQRSRSRARSPTRWRSRRRRPRVTPKGANWLWAWALAIPAGSKKADAAQKFINVGHLEGLHQAGRQGTGLGQRCRPARASRPTRRPSS